ncbi:uncharacterized protein LOC121052283 [Rosa chinensis]|uniref:uncharacterized protein LOC121052283 n=1 Tax=Rosa chinensis TaxID=74649 RepID=UPI001AD90D71|nr:uncharacterized protein LOC121052283 [Rosa chinensis]
MSSFRDIYSNARLNVRMSYFIDSGSDHEENTGYDDKNIGYDDSETQDIGGMFQQQRMVTINKGNWSQKIMNQSTGTRTYASLAHEYELLHGKEPNRWELFKLTYRKVGTQEPIDAASAKAIENFEVAEQKRLSMNVDITAPEIRKEMYAEVLGKEKGNRVRGLGAGVTWDEVPGIHVEERGVSKEVQLLRVRLESQTKEAQERLGSTSDG